VAEGGLQAHDHGVLTEADDVGASEHGTRTTRGMKHAPTVHFDREGLPLEPTAVRLRIAAGGILAIVALIATVFGVAYF